jgi:hypothetical protein
VRGVSCTSVLPSTTRTKKISVKNLWLSLECNETFSTVTTKMVETPPAEIAKQHKEACRLVDSQMPCAPRVNHGEVPEEWKLKPTCPYASSTPPINPNSQDEVEVPNNNNYIDWCISSRGQVDVSPIVKLISEGVNEPAPLPPTSENDKPKNGTKTKPAKKIFGVTVNNNKFMESAKCCKE